MLYAWREWQCCFDILLDWVACFPIKNTSDISTRCLQDVSLSLTHDGSCHKILYICHVALIICCMPVADMLQMTTLTCQRWIVILYQLTMEYIKSGCDDVCMLFAVRISYAVKGHRKIPISYCYKPWSLNHMCCLSMQHEQVKNNLCS